MMVSFCLERGDRALGDTRSTGASGRPDTDYDGAVATLNERTCQVTNETSTRILVSPLRLGALEHLYTVEARPPLA